MRIAVIGAGNVGSGFGRAAVRAGHDVVMAASRPEKAQAVAAEIGATAADSNAAAAQGADVVLLAVPGTAAPSVAAEIAPSLDGGVIVDSTNPLNETFSGLAIQGISGAADVQERAGGAPVVKAFNTVFASRYASPAEDGTPVQVLIAGDDETARGRVAELATSLGFEPIDAGGLRMSRALEEMAFLNIGLNATRGWSWQTAWQLVGPRS
jgi:predicted dinucleotide-binding enzyme